MGSRIRRAVAAAVCAFACGVGALGACSSDSAIGAGPEDGGSADANLPDAGPDAQYEHVYPAPHATLPVVQPRIPDRAKVQAHQKIVTIAWGSDAMRPRLEAFADALGPSDWWRDTTHEYCTGTGPDGCVAPSSVLAHVALPDPPPASLSPREVEDYLQQLITSGTVPPPSDDVVYTFFFPASVKLGEPGFESCVAFDGYHGIMKAIAPLPAVDAGTADDGGDDAGADSGAVMTDGGDGGQSGTPARAIYAVQAQCAGGEAEATMGIAHELIETATDPDGFGFNVNDPAWSAFFLSEIGDLCDYEATQTVGAGFVVQSGWSNAAATSGKNPCAPSVAGDVYFNAAPAVPRLSLKVGESTTVMIMPFSAAPTGDWQLDALDLSALFGDPPALSLTLDRSKVHNGLPVTLTVKLLRQPDPLNTGQRAAVVVLSSTQGKTQRFWPMLVVPR